MAHHQTYYRLTEARDGYEDGDLFRLVARYGDWHPYDAKLEAVDASASGTVDVSLEELFDDWVGIDDPGPSAAGGATATAT